MSSSKIPSDGKSLKVEARKSYIFDRLKFLHGFFYRSLAVLNKFPSKFYDFLASNPKIFKVHLVAYHGNKINISFWSEWIDLWSMNEIDKATKLLWKAWSIHYDAYTSLPTLFGSILRNSPWISITKNKFQYGSRSSN